VLDGGIASLWWGRSSDQSLVVALASDAPIEQRRKKIGQGETK